MKKLLSFAALLSLLVFFAGCETTRVERIDAGTQTDISGYWNDTDVRIVAADLIEQVTGAQWYKDFINENGRKPVVIVGTFRNKSDEHIDTTIISKKLEIALVNSGKVKSVAAKNERNEIRKERDEQQLNSSLETAKNIGNETAADFMLQGDVKTIVDTNGKISTRTYFVSAELINIETTDKVWLGENAEIKKSIKRPSVRF
ncbi:MAG: penicillin-binding protein activator LpoB [Treponema sp.]|nr:penicillin-binding protein activator LpoB [Candidatus Treponema merdequi]